MLKRYDLKPEKSPLSGWAYIVIDTEIGFFSTVGDWGNYAYAWSQPGCEFRAFLLDCDDTYLVGKLLHGRRDAKMYDGDATVKGILEHLEEYNREHREETGADGSNYEKEKALLAKGLHDVEDFRQWLDETSFDAAYELARYEPCPDAVAFCREIMPRFKAMLKAELAAERPVSTLFSPDPVDPQLFIQLIQWHANCSDMYGSDLISRTVGRLRKGERAHPQMPAELHHVLDVYQELSYDEQMQHVAKALPGDYIEYKLETIS